MRMKHTHALQFESLEGRRLLSAARAAHAQAHAADAGPLSISGKLTVNNNQMITESNDAYGYTTEVPVSGTLVGIGKVHGDWVESTDQTGDVSTPDTLSLRSSQGGFTIAFGNGDPGPVHKDGATAFYEHPQKLIAGSGSFAGATEGGSIDLNENARHTEVASITLSGD
jgi:hypothetical protein